MRPLRPAVAAVPSLLLLALVPAVASAAPHRSAPPAPTDGDGGPGTSLTAPPPHHDGNLVHTADEPDVLPGGHVTVHFPRSTTFRSRLRQATAQRSAGAPAAAAPAAVTPAAVATGTADLLAFNDFHGSLTGPTGTVKPTATAAAVGAGGLPQLYNTLRTARAAHPNSLTVAAGDLVGASPLNSAFFDDEPTLRGLSLAGLQVSSVGNHEFDEGQTELLRKQNGGCPAPSDGQGCTWADPTRGGSTTYQAPSFQYLSQNVRRTSDGSTLLPGTTLLTTPNGIKVGFVGVTLKDTPTVVTPSGVAGLAFSDEATEINNGGAALKAAGAQVVVALIHQGGNAGSTVGTCSGGGPTLTGDIAPIVQKLSADVPIVVSAHTHNGYVCNVPTPQGPKLVTQAKAFGQVLTDISMTVDSTGLTTASATNTIVDTAANTLAPGTDATYDKLQAIVDSATSQAAPKANAVIGTLASDIGGGYGTPSGTTTCATQECPSGDVIADSQLRATDATRSPSAAAVIAFMNNGGIRNPYGFYYGAISSAGEKPGELTYGEAFSVQPFGNSLTTKTLTGAQVKTLLEEQFSGCLGQRVGDNLLQVSTGFRYTYDRSQACGSKVSNLTLNGVPLDPAKGYRVTENSFLATGGDNFVTFNDGTDPVGGGQDIDALTDYLAVHPALTAPAPDRAVAAAATPAPALPEAPWAVLLLVAGVGAGTLVLRRRQDGSKHPSNA